MVCATFISSLENVQTSPTVQVNGTQIVGQRVDFSGSEVNQYLGIPYAQPPLGPLRFLKPVPVQNYAPVLHATTKPKACPQYTTQPFPWYIKSPEKSDDCLYLNIWTPAEASATNKKAVLFWIHGGGFRFGSIRSKLYSGIPLSSMGDIIVVTVNYRLGAFGFLSSGTEDGPPNVGLWDILEGLRWVNRNIGAFGGDIRRITISGESAGSQAVGYFTISPLATGLYTRLIMESSSPLTRLMATDEENMALAQSLAKKVGCANDTYTISLHPKEVVDCLRGVDAATLSRAEFEVAPSPSVSFLPQWGDDLLPVDPEKAVEEGNFRCKDLLIGNNQDEGSLDITTADPKFFGFFGKKNPPINRTMGEDMIQKASKKFSDPKAVQQYYLPANLTDDYAIRHQVYTSGGDLFVLCPDVYYAEKCAEQGQSVYFYFFTHRPSTTPWAQWMGVAHFEEVQFVFGKPTLKPKKYRPSEKLLSQQMIDIWSHFVKYGKPNIAWPLYSRGNHSYKLLGPHTVTGENGVGPHLDNCNFLRTQF